MADPVQAVIGERHFRRKSARSVGLYGLFCIIPYQPDAIAFALFGAELIGEFQKQRAGRAAVVGTYVRSIAERIVGIVMAGDHDNSVPRPRKLRNNVSYGKFSFRRIRGKRILLYVVAS